MLLLLLLSLSLFNKKGETVIRLCHAWRFLSSVSFVLMRLPNRCMHCLSFVCVSLFAIVDYLFVWLFAVCRFFVCLLVCLFVCLFVSLSVLVDCLLLLIVCYGLSVIVCLLLFVIVCCSEPGLHSGLRGLCTIDRGVSAPSASLGV